MCRDVNAIHRTVDWSLPSSAELRASAIMEHAAEHSSSSCSWPRLPSDVEPLA
jgi:hypothetical protein